MCSSRQAVRAVVTVSAVNGTPDSEMPAAGVVGLMGILRGDFNPHQHPLTIAGQTVCKDAGVSGGNQAGIAYHQAHAVLMCLETLDGENVDIASIGVFRGGGIRQGV